MCQMSAMYIRSRICRLPPHSVSPSHYINTAKHTRHTYFSDHSRRGQLRIKTPSQTLFTFVFHTIPPQYASHTSNVSTSRPLGTGIPPEAGKEPHVPTC